MNQSEHWALFAFKWCAAAVASIWMTVPAAVQLLVILCGFDLLSCLFTKHRSLRLTLRRVAVTLLLCGVIHVVYTMARSLSGFNVGFDIGAAVAMFYVFGEIIEIVLNCSTVVKIPPKLIEWLETAQGLTNSQKADLDKVSD